MHCEFTINPSLESSHQCGDEQRCIAFATFIFSTEITFANVAKVALATFRKKASDRGVFYDNR